MSCRQCGATLRYCLCRELDGRAGVAREVAEEWRDHDAMIADDEWWENHVEEGSA